MPVRILLLVALALACAATTWAAPSADRSPATPAVAAPTRPAEWAVPVEVNGVPNLHRVSADLYRSAQPTTAEGMAELERLGIKTVVNLRQFHSDRCLLRRTGLVDAHIGVATWHPEQREVVAFLRVVGDPAQRPVLLHCQHGSDRTGAFTAVYRMAVQGWSKDAAIDEMRHGGYGFNRIWVNLAPWVRQLDIAALRAAADLPMPIPDHAR